MKLLKKVEVRGVVELDGLRVDRAGGHRHGRRGLLRLPGVQAGPQKATKGAKSVQKAALLRFPLKEQKA